MQYTGDAHFIYIICSELVIGLSDTCREKNLHSVELFLVLDGVKEIRGAELRGVVEEAAQTPVAQVPSPHLRRSPASQGGGFPWLCWGCAGCCVFLPFPPPADNLPSDGLSHWEDEEVDQTKETERKSSNKPGVVNGWPGEAARLRGARTLPNTRLSKSFNTIYFMLK